MIYFKEMIKMIDIISITEVCFIQIILVGVVLFSSCIIWFKNIEK